MHTRHILPFQGWRIIFFRAVAISLLTILMLRTWQLQFVDGVSFRQDADENRFQTIPVQATRGQIYDRYGVPLALNDPAFLVTITPALLPEEREDVLTIYNGLSALVDVPATRAIADASGRINEASIDELVTVGEGLAPYQSVVIAADVEKDIAMEILENQQNLQGVDIEVRSVRSYPTGQTTAQIIGYLGPIPEDQAQELRELGLDPAFDRVGYAGIEAFFQEELAGTNGSITYQVDIAGRRELIVNEQATVAGSNIRLTLDAELQLRAQQAITDRISAINAEEQRLRTQSGSVIAMNPQTGEILALVSWPTYDNSNFARAIDVEYYLDVANDPLRPLVNSAIGSLYPPGSVWKMITSVGIVEEDVIPPSATLIDPGRLVLPNAFAPNDPAAGQTFVCWDRNGHGPQNLLDAIVNSCDVYYYQAGGGNPDVSPAILRPGGLGITDLYRWSTAFGIGSRLGIEIPGENAGRMPEPDWKRRLYGESWSTGDTYNASFGQGYITVTPLQQVAYIAAIVNDGMFMQPTLLRTFEDSEGRVVPDADINGIVREEFEPNVIRTIVEPPLGEPWVLHIQEDVLVQGENSLACRCERDSDWYDENLCNPVGYAAQFDNNPDEDIQEFQEYTVNVPFDYRWTAGLCDPLLFDTIGRDYIPPIGTMESIDISKQGMVEVVTRGTASLEANPVFPPIGVPGGEGGKTGTAEYCDDIARPQGLCIPGRWPSHAWYVGYAPADNPEIVVGVFLYNAGEGSQRAMPIAREVMEYYFSRPPVRPLQ